ncbi:hypothetical protein [Xanthomonas sp. XNM01]|uniref:hypothetical protein n=1 Tax=Xanthomonas sp. XNM01 TaxID=2769289 RepID=UPI001786C8B0|nr:hypothetical protein [Xanthomonas sp. XNM01]MBD9369727.1 hypothetical protein [Xanthomonas sp. XNM01]
MDRIQRWSAIARRSWQCDAPLLLLLLLLLLLRLLVFALLRLKASRASQVIRAEEAPLSERSEFGRRALIAEKHRAPMQRIGECRRLRFWLLLPRQK